MANGHTQMDLYIGLDDSDRALPLWPSSCFFALTILLIKINGICKKDKEHKNNFGRKKHALIHLFMKDIIWQSSICLFMSQYLFNFMF